MIRHVKKTGLFKFGGWAFIKSFIPSSVTNFNKGVACPEGSHKFGALCYPDNNGRDRKTCPEIGYKKCGPGACSLSTQVCAYSIFGMVAGTFIGALKMTTFILSLGATSAVATPT